MRVTFNAYTGHIKSLTHTQHSGHLLITSEDESPKSGLFVSVPALKVRVTFYWRLSG